MKDPSDQGSTAGAARVSGSPPRRGAHCAPHSVNQTGRAGRPAARRRGDRHRTSLGLRPTQWPPLGRAKKVAVASGALPTRLRSRSWSATRLPAPLLAQVTRLHEAATRNDTDPQVGRARTLPRSSAKPVTARIAHVGPPTPPPTTGALSSRRHQVAVAQGCRVTGRNGPSNRCGPTRRAPAGSEQRKNAGRGAKCAAACGTRPASERRRRGKETGGRFGGKGETRKGQFTWPALQNAFETFCHVWKYFYPLSGTNS